MNYKTIFLPSVDRLSKLVRHRYGCDFEYEPFTENETSLLAPLSTDLKKGMPISSGDSVFFPVFSGDELAGAGYLSKPAPLSKSDVMYLHQIIRLVLESSLNSVDRLDILEEFESHLAEENQTAKASKPRTADKKVVSITSRQKNPFPLTACADMGDELNFPFLIEGLSAIDIHKMAVEIHSRTSRYAFLHMHLINPEAFTSTAAIAALGPITIFIEDLQALSDGQKTQVANYYQAISRPKDGPQFIAGSMKPITDLKHQSSAMSSLITVLSIGYLCMNHPFETYKRENLLDFFYENLMDRHPT